MEQLCWSCENPLPPGRVHERTLDKQRAFLKKTMPGAEARMGYGTCPTCRQRFYIFYNRAGKVWVQPDMIPQVEDAFPPRPGGSTELKKRAWMRAREEAMLDFFSTDGRGRKTRKPRGRTRAARSDPYRVLELSRGAPRREVDRAFRRLAKRCHPDRVAQLDSEIQELAHKKFIELKTAYDSVIRKIADHGIGRGRKG